MRITKNPLVNLGAALAAALLGASCAQERPAINRVQANALKKSFFVGPNLLDPSDDPEFYMRATVVDVPFGAAQQGLFTNTFAQPVSRIKWDIQEQMLTARLTYERIQDTDHKGARATKDGQVVAAFRIQSHFDIKREYNPTSGEEMNVVGENTTDRPWYEREYFRVDWSQNLATDTYEFDTVSRIGIIGGVKFAPMAYYIEDPNDPDHPEFDVDGGYFDVTNKVWAEPGTVNIPGEGEVPACFVPMQWGGSNPIGNCNPTELTIRLAFRQLKDTDYEPVEWTATKMEMFGFFLEQRYGYDRAYGVIDNKWHRFASRYNIWEKSHIDGSVCATAQTTPPGQDPHRDLNKDGTEDECDGAAAQAGLAIPDGSRSSGSRCDEFTHKCTLPLRNRAVKTQAFYYGLDSSPEWFDSTGQAVESWNQALRNAVQAGRYAECMRTGGQLCGQMYRLDTENLGTDRIANVFVWCHNPVAEGDDPACGPVGRKARLGDLRYHMVNIIPTPQTPSPWGIVSNATDPLTGETIAGSVNEWSHVLDRVSQFVVDLVKYTNGELSAEQIADGVNVDAYFQEAKRTAGGMAAPALSIAEMNKRLQAVNTQLSAQNGLSPAERLLPSEIKSQLATSNLIGQGALGPGNSALQARFDALKGTQIEKLLVTPELMQGVGIDPLSTIDDAVVAQASPLRGGLNPTLGKQIRRMRNLALAEQGACVFEAPEPDGLIGLAKLLAKQWPPVDPGRPDLAQARDAAMKHFIAERFSQAALGHELGHSVGLRHNFTGSWDALNYHRPYWMLRTKNGTVTTQCAAGNTNGENCVGPRYQDPVTPAEEDNLIWRYGSSTIMDYPADMTQDMNLLGAYDRAAVRLAYGGTVDVWADLSLNDPKSAKLANNALGFLDGFPGLVGIVDFPAGGQGYESHHYTEYQKLFNLIRYCGPATNPNDPEALNGTACQGPNLDVVDFRDMSDTPKYGAVIGALYPHTVARAAKDPQGRVRHGYMYGSDEYADTGNTPVYRFDAGADHYEQAQFLISVYRNRYIFDYFRHNQVGFNTNSVIAKSMDRYLDKLAANMKTYGLYLSYADARSLSSDGAAKPYTLAVSDIFNTFAQMLTMPEPGTYQPAAAPKLGFAYETAESLMGGNGDFSILPIQGRWLHNDYDYARGGIWWSDYQKQVGSYYEKINAIYYMAEAFDHFVTNTKEDYVDGRYKNLNFATVFPDQTRRLFAQIITNDYKTFAPWVIPTAAPSTAPAPADVRYFDWTDASAPLLRPAGAMAVDPLVGWNEQLYSMVFGAMFFPTSWSQDFINQMRVWVPGASDAVSVPDALQLHFQDPESGIVYAAKKYGTETIDGKPAQKGPGARMLQYADELASEAYLVERDLATNQVLRNGDGTLRYLFDAQGQAQVAGAAARTTLRRYVSNLDVMRQLMTSFGYGPLGHSGR